VPGVSCRFETCARQESSCFDPAPLTGTLQAKLITEEREIESE